jgi:hypothetical protein
MNFSNDEAYISDSMNVHPVGVMAYPDPFLQADNGVDRHCFIDEFQVSDE